MKHRPQHQRWSATTWWVWPPKTEHILNGHVPVKVKDGHTPKVTVTESMPKRILTADTDRGVELKEKMNDLHALLDAYNDGRIREAAPK